MKRHVSLVVLLTLTSLLMSCGPRIRTLTIRSWPGNAQVTVNSVTDEQGNIKELQTGADGLLVLNDVPFPKGSTGPEPIEIKASAQYHNDAVAKIPYVKSDDYTSRQALLPLNGIQTITFNINTSDAKVFLSGKNVEIPNKYTFEFKRETPASVNDNPAYLPIPVVVRRKEYKDNPITLNYQPGKNERQIDVSMELVTEELIDDYYLVRPEPTDPRMVVKTRRFWAQKDTSGDHAKQITKRTDRNQVLSQLALINAIRNSPPRLMFASFRKENNKIYSNIKSTLITETSTETFVTPEQQNLDVYPAYDPDNRTILFSSDQYKPSEQMLICSVDAENPGPATFITRDSGVSHLNVNKQVDGKKIIYTSYKKSAIPSIWYSFEDGSNMTQLGPGSFPKFSPDGSRILFVRYQYDDRFQRVSEVVNGVKIFPSELWVMNDDTTNQMRLMPLDSKSKIEIRGADWHKDGRHIVFSACLDPDSKKRPNFDIYTITDRGTDLIRRTVNESVDDFPIWSQDGNAVFFRSNRGVNWNIWRIDVLLNEE